MSTTSDGLSRRSLLGRSAAGIALGGSLGAVFGDAGAALARTRPGKPGELGYGPLITDPAGRVSLPEGFSYTVIAEAGKTTLESGEPTPSDTDGTAAFPRRGGGSVLVNNHEISGSETFTVPHVASLVYDADAHGGTTTIEVGRDNRRIREYVSVAGTHNNCAGGKSPWNTWITCEESEDVLTLPHGYCFEVDPYDVARNRDPKPIKALGRFAHESVAFAPGTPYIYLTEDAGGPNGLLYRWTSPKRLDRNALRGLADDAGKLEAMQAYDAKGKLVTDLSTITRPGTRLRVRWVTVPDRDAKTVSTRKQFADSQITRSRKLEGMWSGDGGAYFTASFARLEDGSAIPHDGQVWFIDPRKDTIELKLRFAYTPEDQDADVDGPDNITVSAYGGLIMAEDGEGVSHLVGSTERGETFFFARNEESESEWAGPTFSADYRTLFAGIQTPGAVFAISGPFRGGRPGGPGHPGHGGPGKPHR